MDARARSPTVDEVERGLALFRAIAHETRLTVLVVLARSERLCVSDLVERCGSSQSATSHQLRVLKAAGLVEAERDGKFVFYRLADRHVARIVEDALAHAAELAELEVRARR